MTYEVVVYHADSPSAAPEPSSMLTGGSMIDLLFRSVLQHDASATLTVITTRTTDLSAVTPLFTRIDRDIAVGELMLERTRQQHWYATERDWSRPFVFLDSDILVNHSLAGLFSRGFDVGLTWRRDETMPFNGGVTFVNNRNPHHGREFFRKVLAAYEANFRRDSIWWGDQLAVASVLKSADFGNRPETEATIDGIRYAFLDGTIYNYSPSKKAIGLLEPVSRRWILHFKGQRKRYMREFWEIRLSGTNRFSWPRAVGTVPRVWRAGKPTRQPKMPSNPLS